MANGSQLEIMDNLGIDTPFDAVDYDTVDVKRIARLTRRAIDSHRMISIAGIRGSGKTWAVVAALEKMDVRVVECVYPDYRRMLITDIENEMILTLSDERPKRGKPIRKAQLRRILGEASKGREIVVVIEEAHAVHGNTIKALKTLLKTNWMGKKNLFTVILIGQSDPLAKAGMSESRLRADTIYMQGLTANEVCVYIKDTVGRAFDGGAITNLSQKSGLRNYLDLQDTLVSLMWRAWADGREKVTLSDVQKEFGKSKEIPAPPAEKHKKAPLKITREEKQAKDNTAVADILSRRKGIVDEGVRAAG